MCHSLCAVLWFDISAHIHFSHFAYQLLRWNFNAHFFSHSSSPFVHCTVNHTHIRFLLLSLILFIVIFTIWIFEWYCCIATIVVANLAINWSLRLILFCFIFFVFTSVDSGTVQTITHSSNLRYFEEMQR